MDDTTRAIISRITTNYEAPTKLPNGDLCKVFYDCAQLTPADLARLAAEACGSLPKDAFDIAVGIAYEGILFASAVAGGRKVAILTKEGSVVGPPLAGARVIIVDDVMHSGTRIIRAAELLEKLGVQVVAAACIVDRSRGSAKITFGTKSVALWSAYQTSME